VEWVVVASLLVLLCSNFLHWKERQAWSKERQSLTAAAIAPGNPVGAAIVRTAPAAKTEQTKRPMPIDL